jgi:hypothetical protein
MLIHCYPIPYAHLPAGHQLYHNEREDVFQRITSFEWAVNITQKENDIVL